MSVGHRALDEEELTEATVEELYSVLGANNTPAIYARPYTVIFGHDIPQGCGVSVDGKTVYVDRVLYQECMDGAFKDTGLTPSQILDCWYDHEHTEKTIIDGDNPVDDYLPAHRRALKREHEHIIDILGEKGAAKKIERYEETIWPALVRCYHRDVKNPPKDLWVTPISDHATERDHEIIEQMTKLGVADAAKKPKYAVHYNLGPHNCSDCTGWFPKLVNQPQFCLAGCHGVSGLVRSDHHCDMYKPIIGS